MTTVRYSVQAELVNEEDGAIETVWGADFDPADELALQRAFSDLRICVEERLK